MRKSTVTMMAILMLCFGTLLVAAGVLSKPMKQDALIAKELTKLLGYQEVIREGSKVSVTRVPAVKDKTLAEQGRGVVVRLCPSATIRSRRGGVRVVLDRITSHLRDGYAGTRLDWIEFQLESASAPERKPIRTLRVRTAMGGFSDPSPAVS